MMMAASEEEEAELYATSSDLVFRAILPLMSLLFESSSLQEAFERGGSTGPGTPSPLMPVSNATRRLTTSSKSNFLSEGASILARLQHEVELLSLHSSQWGEEALLCLHRATIALELPAEASRLTEELRLRDVHRSLHSPEEAFRAAYRGDHLAQSPTLRLEPTMNLRKI